MVYRCPFDTHHNENRDRDFRSGVKRLQYIKTEYVMIKPWVQINLDRDIEFSKNILDITYIKTMIPLRICL